jgi:hypothetical protein
MLTLNLKFYISAVKLRLPFLLCQLSCEAVPPVSAKTCVVDFSNYLTIAVKQFQQANRFCQMIASLIKFLREYDQLAT